MAAAALWRRRFLRQGKDSDLGGNLADGSERSVRTDAPVQSEASAKPSVASADKRASAGRARGRRGAASRSWSGAEAKDGGEGGARKTEGHHSESNQEENPSGGQSTSEELNRSAERKAEPETRSGQKSARTRNSSVAEEEEQFEQRGLEKTCEDTVESSGSERGEVEKNNEDMRQTSGREVEEKNDEDSNPSLAPVENLEPWQQPDFFCIEDVLKPVAKGRGSVRRSLRHRRSVDVLAEGLAWVEHTSPQRITTTKRRRTCTLSAVSQPPPFPESNDQ